MSSKDKYLKSFAYAKFFLFRNLSQIIFLNFEYQLRSLKLKFGGNMNNNFVDRSSHLRHVLGLVLDSIEVHLGHKEDLKTRLCDDIKKELGISDVKIAITDDDLLVFGDKRADLSGQELTKILFKEFIRARRGRVGRETLVEKVYGRRLDLSSARRKMCDFHNIVKLVSRARKLAQAKLDDPVTPQWDWFPYDSMTEEWILCRSRLPLQ